MAAQKSTKQDELLELGKKLQQFYDSGYVNKKQTILFAFLKGVASGFGVFIGGTIVIALLLWILSVSGQVPLVGRFTERLQHTLEKNK